MKKKKEKTYNLINSPGFMWDNAQIGGVSLFLKDYHLKAYSSTAEKAVLDAPMNLLSASLPSLWIYAEHTKQGDSPQAIILYCMLSEIQENKWKCSYSATFHSSVPPEIMNQIFINVKLCP